MYSKEFQNYHLGPYSFDCSYVIVEEFVITCFADDHAPYCGGETNESVIKSLEYFSVFFPCFLCQVFFPWFPPDEMERNPDQCNLLFTDEEVTTNVQNLQKISLFG